MPESKSHRRAKRKAAGVSGRTEIPQRGGTRLDAGTRRRAYEIERSGDPERLLAAALRLKKSRKPQKVLRVPNQDLPKAAKAMRRAGVSGGVTNLSRTRRRAVRKKK
ncbi:MAG: hypothetical protein ACE5JF_12645 [Anaerolineales bacterium]